MSFLACRVHRVEKTIQRQIKIMNEQQLSDGDAHIRIGYSNINYNVAHHDICLCFNDILD